MQRELEADESGERNRDPREDAGRTHDDLVLGPLQILERDYHLVLTRGLERSLEMSMVKRKKQEQRFELKMPQQRAQAWRGTWLTRFASSAPEKPGVPRAMRHRLSSKNLEGHHGEERGWGREEHNGGRVEEEESSPLSIGSFLACALRISVRPRTSGRGTCKSAGSQQERRMCVER